MTGLPSLPAALVASRASKLIWFQAVCALVSSAPRPVLVLDLALSVKLFFFCHSLSVRFAGQAVLNVMCIRYLLYVAASGLLGQLGLYLPHKSRLRLTPEGQKSEVGSRKAVRRRQEAGGKRLEAEGKDGQGPLRACTPPPPGACVSVPGKEVNVTQSSIQTRCLTMHDGADPGPLTRLCCAAGMCELNGTGEPNSRRGQ